MNWQIVTGISSLLIATITLYICVKIKELGESLKTMELLASLAPACEDPNVWALLIRHLVQRKRLRACDQNDEEYLIKLFERLGVKIDSNKKRLVDAIPTD